MRNRNTIHVFLSVENTITKLHIRVYTHSSTIKVGINLWKKVNQKLDQNILRVFEVLCFLKNKISGTT